MTGFGFKGRRWLVAAAALVFLFFLGAGWSSSQGSYDLIIVNGLVVDGTGKPAYKADVGARRGRIVEIGSLAGQPARRKIDARGQVVAPGFIDAHTNVEGPLAHSTRRFVADNFLLQGVTTVITGNCGRSAPDIAAFFRKLRRLELAVNVATLVGHNTIRRQVCGWGAVQPSSRQLARMEALVKAGLEAGALGFSTGLCYKPGLFAHPDEVAALVHVVAEEGGIYATHIRDEGAAEPAALKEAIETAKRAGVRKLHICHFKAAGRSQWGTARARLDWARQALGPKIRLSEDIYPYTSLSTTLTYLVPPAAFRLLGRHLSPTSENFQRAVDVMLADLHRDGWPDYSRVRVAYCPRHQSWVGRTIPDIVKAAKGASAGVRDQAAWILRNQAKGDVQIIAEEMSEQDVRQLIAAPNMVFGSDSSVHYRGLGRPHPRGAGTFPRIFAEYVRNLKILSLEDAVHRATGLTAEIFGIPNRGLIREGYWADMVVFDPARIQDHATFQDPWAPPTGIAYVIENGRVVVHNGRLTGVLPGKPVLRDKGN